MITLADFTKKFNSAAVKLNHTPIAPEGCEYLYKKYFIKNISYGADEMFWVDQAFKMVRQKECKWPGYLL